MGSRSIVVLVVACFATVVITGCSMLKSGKTDRKAATPAARIEAPKPAEVAVMEEPPDKWEQFDTDESNVKYFLNKESVSYPARNRIRFWLRRVFPERASQKEIISLNELNCNEQRYRSIHTLITKRDGSVESFTKTTPWINIYRSTSEGYFQDKFCEEAGKVK